MGWDGMGGWDHWVWTGRTHSIGWVCDNTAHAQYRTQSRLGSDLGAGSC